MSSHKRTVMASSPPSSDVATHQGTPSTNTTNYSPESAPTPIGYKSKPKTALSLGPISRGHTNLTASIDRDPFLAPTPISDGSRSVLSPTADVFTPKVGSATGTRTEEYFPINYRACTLASTTPLGAGPLVQTSVPDYGFNVDVTHGQGTSPPGVIGRPILLPTNIAQLDFAMQNMAIDFDEAVVTEGVFSFDEQSARAFAIEGCTSSYTLPAIARLLKLGGLPTDGIDGTHLHRLRQIIVSFDDVRDARKAHIAVQANLGNESWITSFTSRDLAMSLQNTTNPLCSMFEGQVLVSVFWPQDARRPLSASDAINSLKRVLFRFGEVKAIRSVPIEQRRVREFRVEYFKVSSAVALIDASRSLIQAESIFIEANVFNPPTIAPIQSVTTLPTPVNAPIQQVSLTGRSMVPTNDPGNMHIAAHLGSDEGSGRRHPPQGQYTRVEVARIRRGIDVRTTVMLRNIPNRVTQSELKRVIDQTSLGDYDFMYLRIDFANNCNVGYAFINFIDPYAIIPFAEARQGMCWDVFQSSKVAEISYATIQGRENLVQKFRNSSVMLEHPDFRPKLYYAKPHPKAGEEQPFDPPDNMQKMRRSVENAEHVGLFLRRDYPSATGRRSRRPFRLVNSLPMAVRPFGPAPITGPGVQAFPNTPFTPSIAPRIASAPACVGSFTYDFGDRLFAPRQGAAVREFSRRRRSQFDRGTPGAELELQQSSMVLNAGGRFARFHDN